MLTFLTSKVGLILIAIVLAAAGTFVVVKQIEVKTLTAENATLRANNQILKQNITNLEDANKTSTDTIQKLIQERADAQAALDTLAASTARQADQMARVNRKIEELMKDPKADGELAPVLRETLREIQKRAKK